MKRRNINSILKEVVKKIEPSEKELKFIDKSLDTFLDKLKKNVKKSRLNLDVFVGGSFAKGTMIKRNFYDIDIFVRFDKKYKNEELSRLTKKLLKGIGKFTIIHGSRDYFRIKISKWLVFEVVPVRKIKSIGEAENITDRSYSHVHYIKRKIKSHKIMDDIRLAKAFCYANNCYGAESYVNGFSGYALELLVYRYKGFLRFIRAMTKIKNKEVIDIEKHYKNRNHILMDINASKLNSPIILIDPTFKQRNALAALSEETFRKFQKACRDFLKNPSIKAFETKEINIGKIKKDAKRKKYEFILLEAKTNKQEGDVAGSKLGKFYNHLSHEIEKFFDVKNKGFEYNNKKSAKYFFVVKKKKELLIKGPLVSQKEHVKKFKKKYKKTFTKKGKTYTIQKTIPNLKKFLNDWKTKNKKQTRDMAITGLGVVS
jgi:tRNA nucleotidyltransferase (CCA-adding enzyme)